MAAGSPGRALTPVRPALWIGLGARFRADRMVSAMRRPCPPIGRHAPVPLVHHAVTAPRRVYASARRRLASGGAQGGDADHAGQDSDAHGLAHRGAGPSPDNQRHPAQHEGKRGHKDRPQPHVASHDRGLHQRPAVEFYLLRQVPIEPGPQGALWWFVQPRVRVRRRKEHGT